MLEKGRPWVIQILHFLAVKLTTYTSLNFIFCKMEILIFRRFLWRLNEVEQMAR